MKRLHDNQPEISIPDCCSLFGYSKQAYYKREKQLQSELLCEEIILKMVNSLRQDQPVLGGRKLYHILKSHISVIIKILRRLSKRHLNLADMTRINNLQV